MPSGCTCNANYKGAIVAATLPPAYYYGSCVFGTNTLSVSNLTWTSVGPLPFGAIITDFVASPTVLMVVDTGNIWVSTNAANWSKTIPPVSLPVHVVYNDVLGVFLALSVSSNNVSLSTNGVTWSPPVSVTTSSAVTVAALSVANGVFFYMPSSSSATSYYYSLDGYVWKEAPFAPNGAMYAEVSYGARVYLTVATRGSGMLGYMLMSTAPHNLTFYSQGSSFAGPLAGSNPFGNGVFIATYSLSSQYYTSTTGSPALNSWSLRVAPFVYFSVFFARDRFFMVPYNDPTVLAVSSDGLFWYPTALPGSFNTIQTGVRAVYLSSMQRFFYLVGNGGMAWMPS